MEDSRGGNLGLANLLELNKWKEEKSHKLSFVSTALNFQNPGCHLRTSLKD